MLHVKAYRNFVLNTRTSTYQNPISFFVKPLQKRESVSKKLPNAYRFGFNGMERTDEVYGAGNEYTTEFRQYDPRLGRWLSIDPEFRAYAWQSPYVAFDNNPIVKTDPRGDAPGDPKKTSQAAEKGVEAANKSQGKLNDGKAAAACNIGVKTAVKEATGSKSLYAKSEGGSVPGTGQANNIGTALAKNQIPDFVSFDGDYAAMQEAANNGEIIIGVYNTAEKGGGGHIIMIVPGELSDRGFPQKMETGKNRRESKTPLNDNMGSKTRAATKYYIYKPALSNSNSEEVQSKTSMPNQQIIRSAPPTVPSDYFENSSAPILRDVGDLLRTIGY